ncbi:uncharacterized protein LOC135688946 [Rhopilema esculentum]|uniref:uncharacterized protein LOC135688946 n=1 Tax=Rhopilema esculentum TaxID=499914 RepID=UPI0031D5E474
MHSKYESMRDFYDSRIEELKKENAEMTSRITSATDVTNCSEKCETTKQEHIEKPKENCLKLDVVNWRDGTDTTKMRRAIPRNEENINDKDLKEEVEFIAMKAELNKKEMKNFKISVTSVSEIIKLLTPANKE